MHTFSSEEFFGVFPIQSDMFWYPSQGLHDECHMIYKKKNEEILFFLREILVNYIYTYDIQFRYPGDFS